MLLDILFAIALVIGIIKGYQRGLILGLFSLVSVIIGLAAAMKLSAIAAVYIGRAIKVSEEWMPVVSFILVFLGVVLLIRIAANALEKILDVALLSWVNRLGGIVFYSAIGILILSVLLFYAEEAGWVQEQTIKESVTYSFVQPFGPYVINSVSVILPFLGDAFEDLKQFFESLADKANPS